MRKANSLAIGLSRDAAELTEKYPPGTRCRYWRGAREGPGQETTIRSPYSVVAGQIVVWLKGVSGCIAATHVEPIPDDDEKCEGPPLLFNPWSSGALSRLRLPLDGPQAPA